MNKLLNRIHSAAPVRICDVGGWTDTWFAGHGAVFNIAVQPYVEVQINIYRPSGKKERVTLHLENYGHTYSLNPEQMSYNKHPLIEAAVDTMEIPGDISIHIDIFSDAPPGASVGTSAAVSVALIGALDALTPGKLNPHEVAALAHRIETEKLGLQSGIQDQLASAFGGINFINMPAFPFSEVSPVNMPKENLLDLERRLILVYIGTPHSSSEVHKKVIANLGDDAGRDPRIDGLRKLAAAARDAALSGDLEDLGDVMNRSIGLQRSLHPHLVCEKSEEIIDIAGSFAACGCKVNGAGGDGGSITILGDGDVKKKRELIHTLKKKGYPSIPVALSPAGLKVWQTRQ
ncbi:MAG: GHMP kinase [Candidatus Aminicenantes bacterium]|nr:GHMP kinase [Candidatus Aminicenantes bacterium]